MVKFMSFSSGSCGNCYFLGTDDKGLLIDAGISLRRLKQGLESAGLTFGSFENILVTHDHFDHIRHLGSYCRKLKKNVYSTSAIHTAIARYTWSAEEISPYRKMIDETSWNEIDGFMVKSFVVPHDAVQTVGYAIHFPEHKFVIMTDIGRMTDEAVSYAREADTVVIESNYDMDMLMSGSYTYELKMRIVQGCGHLSNGECADAIRHFMHPDLRHIFLCHLSENNNTPDLAYSSAASAIESSCAGQKRPSLHCLPRMRPSECFIL